MNAKRMLAAAVMGAVLGTMALGAETAPATAPAKVVKVRGLEAAVITATGRMEALVRAKISPRVSGHLMELGKDAQGRTLDAGMYVKKGDVLFVLDDTTHKSNEASAKAALASAQATLDNLKAPTRPERIEQAKQAVKELEARVAEGKADEARYVRLVETEKTVAAKRLEEAKTALAALEAQLASAKARLAESEAGATKTEIAVAEARVKEAEAAVKAAGNDVRDTTIRAPFDGLIVRRMKGVGDYAAANPPVEVFELVSTEGMEADVRLPESYFSRVKAGATKVKVGSPLMKASMDAVVTRVVDEVDPVRGTFAVRIAVPAGSGMVPGAFVTADVMLEGTSEKVLVPGRAVSGSGAGTYVWVMKDGKKQRRDVTVGERLTEQVVVTKGLSVGEEVVVGD